MHPEYNPDRYIVAVAGPNSTGKSELARQMSRALRMRVETAVIHVGDFFRFFATLPGGFRLDSPEQIKASAQLALQHVHCECDNTTGEIHLKPNGLDRFLQSAHNGYAGSRLGGNDHLAEFIADFIFDLLEEHGGNDGVTFIDGRKPWGARVAIRTHAEPAVQRAFFYQEREEARGWTAQTVGETIQERDILDAPLLADMNSLTKNVIDLYRTNPTIEATSNVAGRLAGIIYDRYQHRFDHQEYPVLMIVDN